MIKNISYFLMVLAIFVFFFFVIQVYLSDENKKQINVNRVNIDKFIKDNISNLPLIENDTKEIIEFNTGFTNKPEKTSGSKINPPRNKDGIASKTSGSVTTNFDSLGECLSASNLCFPWNTIKNNLKL